MSDSPEVLTTARQRATTAGLPYAGALTPAEAWVLLQSDPRCRLVDVRSRAEWEFVGRVPGALEIEWKSWPGMVPNAGFVDALREAVGGIEAPRLLFLCRSGARSHDAAVAASVAGLGECFNVLEGFEGDRDALQHRNTIGGWRSAGLPWTQG